MPATYIFFVYLEWGEWIETNDTEERYRHCMRKTLKQRNETLDGKFFLFLLKRSSFLRGWGLGMIIKVNSVIISKLRYKNSLFF